MTKLSWRPVVTLADHADAVKILENMKTMINYKSQLQVCQLCGFSATSHQMRYQLFNCGSAMCAEKFPNAPCTWRAKMETCQLTNKSSIEELNLHHTIAHSPKIRPFTHELKLFAQSMARNDMRPAVIRNAMAVHFSLDASQLPMLEQVRQHVAAFRRNHLENHDALDGIIDQVGAIGFTGCESESQVFSFGYELDMVGRPQLGRGTYQHPFFVGYTTRRLMLHLDRGSTEYIFHVDATFKLAHVDFPTIVCGISGRSREFHLVAIFQTSQ
jgi:hypothetical protein